MINIRRVQLDLQKISKSIEAKENTASVRAINIVAGSARTMIANDVKDDTGISVGTAKRRILLDRAKKGKYHASLFISAQRVTYPSPRQLKMGASYIASGKIRRKNTTKVVNRTGTGSRPFVIKGVNSGKKVPVYVDPSRVHKKRAKYRTAKSMYFSSLAHVARKDWNEKVDAFSIVEFKKEYPKQLKKTKYRGRK